MKELTKRQTIVSFHQALAIVAGLIPRPRAGGRVWGVFLCATVASCSTQGRSPSEASFINNGDIPSYTEYVGVPFNINYLAQHDAAFSVPNDLANVSLGAGVLGVICQRTGDGSVRTELLGRVVNIITLECISGGDDQGRGG